MFIISTACVSFNNRFFCLFCCFCKWLQVATIAHIFSFQLSQPAEENVLTKQINLGHKQGRHVSNTFTLSSLASSTCSGKNTLDVYIIYALLFDLCFRKRVYKTVFNIPIPPTETNSLLCNNNGFVSLCQ